MGKDQATQEYPSGIKKIVRVDSGDTVLKVLADILILIEDVEEKLKISHSKKMGKPNFDSPFNLLLEGLKETRLRLRNILSHYL